MQTFIFVFFCLSLAFFLFFTWYKLRQSKAGGAKNNHSIENESLPEITVHIRGEEQEARLEKLQLMTKSASFKEVVNDALDLYQTAVEMRSKGVRLFVGEERFAVQSLHMHSLDRVDKKEASN